MHFGLWPRYNLPPLREGGNLKTQIHTKMSKEKEKRERSDKKAPQKNMKEKRAEKAYKREKKGKMDFINN